MESNNNYSVENVEENSVSKPDDCSADDKDVPSPRLPTVVIRPYRRTGVIFPLCQYILIRILCTICTLLVCTPPLILVTR